MIRRYIPGETPVPRDAERVLIALKNSIMTIGGVDSVVLFGSYSKGTYNNDSDIDIAVFVNTDDKNTHLSVFHDAVRMASEYLLDIQILVFGISELEHPDGIVDEVVQFGLDMKYT